MPHKDLLASMWISRPGTLPECLVSIQRSFVLIVTFSDHDNVWRDVSSSSQPSSEESVDCRCSSARSGTYSVGRHVVNSEGPSGRRSNEVDGILALDRHEGGQCSLTDLSARGRPSPLTNSDTCLTSEAASRSSALRRRCNEIGGLYCRKVETGRR